MRKTGSKILILCLVALGLVGCTTLWTPVINSTDLQTTDFSKSMKQGESCQLYVLGFLGPFGNASVVEAAANAGISKVNVVDQKYSNYILFAQQCVVAYGD